jgi:multicomponent Na+:H+ antiporter subunit G
MIDVVSSVLFVLGSVLALLSAVGLHRFRDPIARSHAAGKVAPLGAALVAVAVSLEMGSWAVAMKLGVAFLLLILTFPTGVHMIVRAAYRSGTELTPEVEVDELADTLSAETLSAETLSAETLSENASSDDGDTG